MANSSRNYENSIPNVGCEVYLLSSLLKIWFQKKAVNWKNEFLGGHLVSKAVHFNEFPLIFNLRIFILLFLKCKQKYIQKFQTICLINK